MNKKYSERQAISAGSTPAREHNGRGIVFRLAIADLLHEWILNLCLTMAIAAVLSPLLLLFGLKYGTVETLRFRLIQDPRNREIKPMASKSFSRQWIEQIRSRPDVAFIIPTTRQISAVVDAHVKAGDQRNSFTNRKLNIIPTEEGDRLILENGAPIPNLEQCVLTATAAEDLGAETGNVIITEAKRLKGDQYEAGRLELTVAGVLSPRASSLRSMYVDLKILEAVERFKDGMAVGEFGWPGSTPKAYPVFNGLVVLIPQKLDKIQEVNLINNTGFAEIMELSQDELYHRAGYRSALGNVAYLLVTRNKPVGVESVGVVRNRLRGTDAVLIPWVENLSAQLSNLSKETFQTISLRALTILPSKAAFLDPNPVPNWDDMGEQANGWRKVMLPLDIKQDQKIMQLHYGQGDKTLIFPVEVLKERTLSQHAFIPVRLAGILNLFRQREIVYTPKEDEFELTRLGYAGFRLYAATIDDVEPLRQYFEDSGLPVHTEAERIRDVTELDRYLTLIFWLIAVVGLVGGTAALTASLYASVERKRRELGVLRLIGMSRLTLFRYPLYESICIAAGGFFAAFVFFQMLAKVINTLFQKHLQAQESLCILAWSHFGITLTGTVTAAIMAGTLASWRATRIDPAEALRDE